MPTSVNGIDRDVAVVTTAQKNAMTPTTGTVVFDSDLNGLYTWTGAAWELTVGAWG